MFHGPKQRNESELVYAINSSLSDMVDVSLATMPESDTDSNCSSIPPLIISTTTNKLYHGGRQLRQAMGNVGMQSTSWPPRPSELSLTSSQEAVSSLLFNTLALAIGTSEEV